MAAVFQGYVPSSTATGGAGISGITVEDEGTPLATLATTLDFVGAGVAATGAGAEKTITISGGGDVTKVGTPANNQIGVWTGDGTIEGDPALTFNGVGTDFSVDGQITCRTAGAGEIRNSASSSTIPTLIPRNDRTDVGWGSTSGSDNMRLILDGGTVCTWFHTGAAGNDTQWSFLITTKTASTTQTQGQGSLNGNRYTNVNVVANVDDVVTLPNVGAGVEMVIFNTGANRVQIFPAAGDQILPNATNVSITLDPNDTIVLNALSATEWIIAAKTDEVTDITAIASGTEANPSLAWGDGDTGFHESSDDILLLSVGGTNRFQFRTTNGGQIQSAVAGGPGMRNVAAGATGPTLYPNMDDTNTGIGSGGSDNISLVAGGQSALAAQESGAVVTLTLGNNSAANHSVTGNLEVSGTSGFTVSNASGPQMINEAPSSINPTLLPNKTDPDTGIGWNAADELGFVSMNKERVLQRPLLSLKSSGVTS